MAISPEDYAYVEDRLGSAERLLEEGDAELANLTLDLSELELDELADRRQAARLRSLRAALARVDEEGVAAGPSAGLRGLH